jgi:hypothetical protein
MLAASPAAAADRRVEAAAKEALRKAANDFLATDYDAAATRLHRALQTCGTTKCTAATRAALNRDLGTMQFHNGDFGAARKSFAEALRLKPDIKLNPDYDSPDLQTAWREATAAAGGGPSGGAEAGGGAGPQPTGDFTHTPAPAQKSNTPLPIYVEAASPDADIERVTVKYRSGSMSDWTRLDLKKMGDGWGGQIPCTDVTVGTMRYWIQGFGADGDPVANSGDPKHPFAVPIKNQISGEAPHLPGKPAPKSCDESSDCPPGLPGCGTKEEEGGAAETESETETAKPAADGDGPYARFWVGFSLAFDLITVPHGDNVCILTEPGAKPANTANFYCTLPSGGDFPARSMAGLNDNNNLIKGMQAGHVDGGVGFGDVRIMLSADYAITQNLLAGVRIGYVLNAYNGSAAVQDGRAFGPNLHLEARATYLLGRRPLRNIGFVPMGMAGLGISEFDWHTTAVVIDGNQQMPVNVWYTDAPFFLFVGGGVRYNFSMRTAFTAALRLDLTMGGNGVLPTVAPEFGVTYGF